MNKLKINRLRSACCILSTAGLLLAFSACSSKNDYSETLKLTTGDSTYAQTNDGKHKITNQKLYEELRYHAFSYVTDEIYKQGLDNLDVTTKKYYSSVAEFKNEDDVDYMRKNILQAIYTKSDIEDIDELEKDVKLKYELVYRDTLLSTFGIKATLEEVQGFKDLTTQDLMAVTSGTIYHKILSTRVLERAKFLYAVDKVKAYNTSEFIEKYDEDDEKTAYFKGSETLISSVFIKKDYTSNNAADYSDLRNYYIANSSTFFDDESDLKKIITDYLKENEDYEIETDTKYNSYIVSFDTKREAEEAIEAALSKATIDGSDDIKQIHQYVSKPFEDLEDYHKTKFTELELHNISSQLASLMTGAFEKNLKKNKENGNHAERTYTHEIVNYDGKYYLFYLEDIIEGVELPEFKDFLSALKGTAKEDDILTKETAQIIYNYIDSKLYEAKASVSVTSTLMTELIEECYDKNKNYITINEKILSLQYDAFDDNYKAPGSAIDKNIFMQIGNAKYHLNDVYTTLETISGVSTAQALLLNEIVVADSSLDACITTKVKEDNTTSYENVLKSFKKGSMEASGYPKSMGVDNFKLLYFKVEKGTSKNDIIKKHYEVPLKKTYAVEQYLFPKTLADKGINNNLDYDDAEIDEIQNYITELDLLKNANDFRTLTQLANKARKDYYNATISHLLLYVDYNNDGQPDNPQDYIDALKEAGKNDVIAAFNARLQDIMNYVYEEIKISNYTTLDTVLTDIVKEYNKNGSIRSTVGSSDELNWGDVKSGSYTNSDYDFRILMKTESLGEINNATGSNYVVPFTNAVKELYKNIVSVDGFKYDSETFKDQFLTNENDEAKVVQTSFGYHFLMATAVKDPESLINRVTDDVDYEDYLSDYTGSEKNKLYYFDSDYNLIVLTYDQNDPDNIIYTVIGTTYTFEKDFIRELTASQAEVYGLEHDKLLLSNDANYITISQAICYFYQTAKGNSVSMNYASEEECSNFLTQYYNTYATSAFQTYMTNYRYVTDRTGGSIKFTSDENNATFELLKVQQRHSLDQYVIELADLLENDTEISASKMEELKGTDYDYYTIWWETFKF